MDPIGVMNEAVNTSMAHFFGSNPDVKLGEETPLLAAALKDHRLRKIEVYHQEIVNRIEELEKEEEKMVEKPERPLPSNFEVSLEDLELPMLSSSKIRAEAKNTTKLDMNPLLPSYFCALNRMFFRGLRELKLNEDNHLIDQRPISPVNSEYAWGPEDDSEDLSCPASPARSEYVWRPVDYENFDDVMADRAPSPTQSEYMWGPEDDVTGPSGKEDLPYFAGVSYNIGGDMVLHLVNWKTPERLRLFERVGDLITEFMDEQRLLLEKETKEKQLKTEKNVTSNAKNTEKLLEKTKNTFPMLKHLIDYDIAKKGHIAKEIWQDAKEKADQKMMEFYRNMKNQKEERTKNEQKTEEKLPENSFPMLKDDDEIPLEALQEAFATAELELKEICQQMEKDEQQRAKIELKSMKNSGEDKENQNPLEMKLQNYDSDFDDFESASDYETSDDESYFEAVDEVKGVEERGQMKEGGMKLRFNSMLFNDESKMPAMSFELNSFCGTDIRKKKETETLRLQVEEEEDNETLAEDVMADLVEKLAETEKRETEEKMKQLIEIQEKIATTHNVDEKMKLLDEVLDMMTEDWFQKL